MLHIASIFARFANPVASVLFSGLLVVNLACISLLVIVYFTHFLSCYPLLCLYSFHGIVFLYFIYFFIFVYLFLIVLLYPYFNDAVSSFSLVSLDYLFLQCTLWSPTICLTLQCLTGTLPIWCFCSCTIPMLVCG